MSHFAKLDSNSVVIFVTTGSDSDNGKESEISLRTGDVYKQTSYNTRSGVHYEANSHTPSSDQTKSFRKNYAGIGYSYDAGRDAFIPPKTFPSWILNEETCGWDAPTAMPDDGLGPSATKEYAWDEENTAWVFMRNFPTKPYPSDGKSDTWDEESKTWSGGKAYTWDEANAAWVEV